MPLHYDGEVRIHKVPMGPYDNNGYLLIHPQTGEGIIIDTPAEPEKLLRELQDTWVKAILITHNHRDHLLGFSEIRQRTGAPVGVHAGDADLLPSPPDFLLQDGDTLQVGPVPLTVLHTPGHTPGSVCLLAGRYLFTGDTLFPGGPGKSRSPLAFQELVESIVTKLLPLPKDTVVYPGHGPDTTIGQAREEYQVFASRPHHPDLCGDVLWLES
ncbi:MAG: MBL fold metallo-hydrolase [Dehalococcoidia bacterium]